MTSSSWADASPGAATMTPIATSHAAAGRMRRTARFFIATPNGFVLLVVCARHRSRLGLALGHELLELLLRDEGHLGQEDEHVVDGTVAPTFPVPGFDVARVLGRRVIPADDMQDGSLRQERRSIVFVHVDLHPIVVVPGAVQHLP